jgi:hypothetical protein
MERPLFFYMVACDDLQEAYKLGGSIKEGKMNGAVE